MSGEVSVVSPERTATSCRCGWGHIHNSQLIHYRFSTATRVPDSSRIQKSQSILPPCILLGGSAVYRPRRKSLRAGDRVAITDGALCDMRAVVVSVGLSGQLTLQPDGWPLGLHVQVSKYYVRRDWGAVERPKPPAT